MACVMPDRSINKNEEMDVKEDGAIGDVCGLGTVAQKTGDSWRERKLKCRGSLWDDKDG